MGVWQAGGAPTGSKTWRAELIPPLWILSVPRTSNAVTLVFRAEVGETYHALRSNTIEPATWTRFADGDAPPSAWAVEATTSQPKPVPHASTGW